MSAAYRRLLEEKYPVGTIIYHGHHTRGEEFCRLEVTGHTNHKIRVRRVLNGVSFTLTGTVVYTSFDQLVAAQRRY